MRGKYAFSLFDLNSPPSVSFQPVFTDCARRAVGIEHWKCGRFRLAASLFGIDCMTDPESALLLRDVGVLDWAVAPVRSFADILSEPELDVLIGDSKALYYAALGDAHPTLAGVAQVLVHASASRRCACTALRAYAEKCQSRTGDVIAASNYGNCCYYYKNCCYSCNKQSKQPR